MQEQEHRRSVPGETAFAVGFVTLIGAFYVLVGFAMWDAWQVLMAH
jgi:hypothetical protein